MRIMYGPADRRNPSDLPLKLPRNNDFTDIFGYLEAHGDEPIGARAPLNEVDALIISRLAYLYFEGLVGPSYTAKVKIGDIAGTYLSLSKTDAISFLLEEDFHLVTAIQNRARFSRIKVCGYRTFFSEKEVKQFAAMTFILPNRMAYIAFRGTDGSLSGWREDFDIGFLGVIPSDLDALRYARETMEALPNMKGFYIGGHSKGGNLAQYAAFKLSKRLKERIAGVYIFDAPGFRRDVFTKLDRETLSDRIFGFAPTQSVVGMILYSGVIYTPIVSRNFLLLQHDIYNWCVQGKSLVRGRFQSLPYAVKRMSKEFFETMDIPQLERCIDALFGAIRVERGDMRNASLDISLARMVSMVFMVRRVPPAERKTFLKVFSTIARNMKSIVSIERDRDKLSDIRGR